MTMKRLVALIWLVVFIRQVVFIRLVAAYMLIVESLSLATKCTSSKELWRCNLKDVLVVTVATEIEKRHLDATKLQCGSNILQPYLLTFRFVSYFKIEQVIFNNLRVYSGI